MVFSVAASCSIAAVQLLLQLLGLLLQHADVGHHLHFAARLRRGRDGQHQDHADASKRQGPAHR